MGARLAHQLRLWGHGELFESQHSQLAAPPVWRDKISMMPPRLWECRRAGYEDRRLGLLSEFCKDGGRMPARRADQLGLIYNMQA